VIFSVLFFQKPRKVGHLIPAGFLNLPRPGRYRNPYGVFQGRPLKQGVSFDQFFHEKITQVTAGSEFIGPQEPPVPSGIGKNRKGAVKYMARRGLPAGKANLPFGNKGSAAEKTAIPMVYGKGSAAIPA
jgi:hypothetical protein